MPSETRSWLQDICLLTLLISVLYGMFLGSRPLTPPDEARYSEIPREMVLSGDYITPHLNGVKYFEKPILFYWLQSFSIKLFGLNEWAMRLVTSLMGVLGCLLTYWGTRKLYDRRTAILSALILGSSILYSGLAHFITLDMTVSVFLSGCFLAFLVGNRYPPGKKRRYYMWLMYTFAALATLTKGLIGIMFPGMIIFTWLLITNQWRQLSSYCLVSGFLLFLLITLPWHILVQLKNPEFFNFYFYEQHFLRYLTDYASRRQPIWFFPVVLIMGFFPWTGFLVGAIKDKLGALKTPKQYFEEIFLLLWAGMIFLFYWVSKSQLIPYILPIFTPLAIIVGHYINNHWDEKTKNFSVSFLAAFLFSLILSIGAVVFNHWHKPFEITYIDSIIIVPILFGVSTLIYQQKGIKLGFSSLLISVFTLLLLTNWYYPAFETKSIKPLAKNLVNILKPGDYVYNFHNYNQDLPFYLGRQVRIINWKGELSFGSQHQPINNIFLSDQELQHEWPSQGRKYMVLKKDDLAKLEHTALKFYLLGTKGKYALICNQEAKP